MKSLFFVLLTSFITSNVFGQKFPEYHKGVVNTYHTPQRGILLAAVEAQKLSLVDSLIKEGYDINEPNVYGGTVLCEVLQRELIDTSFIDSLLTRGSCLDCGSYISYYFNEKGSEHKFDVPLRNAIGTNAFTFLFNRQKQLGLTKMFSDKSLMETAVLVVGLKPFIELSNYFDFKNINCDKNYEGQTLLTQLTESIVISYLFLQLQDRNDELALVLKDGEKMINFLLRKGADINKPNDKGETALTIVKEIPQLVKFLKKKGAKL
jgi:hypothetical protein